MKNIKHSSRRLLSILLSLLMILTLAPTMAWAQGGGTEEYSGDSSKLTETTFPANEYTGSANGLSVKVVAEEGAFPAGTTMKVSAVNSDVIRDSVADSLTDVVQETDIAAVDITFYNKEGDEIEPLIPVHVSLNHEFLSSDCSVVHITDDGNATVMENVSFDADSKSAEMVSDEFSVYAVVTSTIADNRMIIVKYNDEYYVAKFDGTLVKADDFDGTGVTISDESDAMLWDYYTSTYSQSRRLRYLNGGSNDYIYLAPNQDNALSSTQTNITYGSNHIYNGNNYIGVKENSDGSLSLSGNNSSANAAEIYFASVTLANGQSVGHIDINMQATADVTVSLAYGKYYDANGNEVLNVTKQSREKGSASEVVPIDVDDLKEAQITAYKSDGSGNKSTSILDNAFYITGYEPSTAEGEPDQVRMNGSFRVTESTATNTAGRSDRLNKRVFYTVSVVKPVDFTLKYDYDGDGTPDILYKEDGTPIEVTLYVTLSSSFDYWNPDNECPGIGNRNNWRAGDIVNSSISGMDFALGSGSDSTAKVVALEITKHYVDASGNEIKVAQDQTLTFNVYTTSDNPDELIGANIASGYDDASANLSDYDALVSAGLYSGKNRSHVDTVKVGAETSMALVYDYDAESGIYCIEETNPAETITDTSGNSWTYDSTRIETEYAWRDDSISNTGYHVSTGTTSVPEVAGAYTYQGSDTWSSGGETGDYFNEFLEFEVYNIYKNNSFYVYHSSDNTIEKISMTDDRVTENGFDIVNETKTGCLYGGYYKSYGGQVLTDEEIIALDYNDDGTSGGAYGDVMVNGDWAADATGAIPYTGEDKATKQGGHAWDISNDNVYTSSGKTLTPEIDAVYYLKEVPDRYIAPKTFTYYKTLTDVLQQMYMLTCIDDANYNSVGFNVAIGSATPADKKEGVVENSTVYKTFTVGKLNEVTNSEGHMTYEYSAGANQPFTPAYAFGSAFFDADDFVYVARLFNAEGDFTDAIGKTVTFVPFWITKDNIKVDSIKKRAMEIGSNEFKDVKFTTPDNTPSATPQSAGAAGRQMRVMDNTVLGLDEIDQILFDVNEETETVAMHRLYNPNSGEHFYTGSTQEKDNLIAAGWNYEGIAWNAPAESETPVYRLYNPNAGDHHYTVDAAERDALADAGWEYEGIGWYSADAQDAQSVPLYRVYNPNAYLTDNGSGAHHYTVSAEESAGLIALGWIDEGIAWYGVEVNA